MPPSVACYPVPWTDPAVIFAGGWGDQDNVFWLDAGPGATEGFSWMGTGTPHDRAPRDVVLTASADEQSVPGGFVGGWVGWAGYDDAAAAAGAPAAYAAGDGPAQLWLQVERVIAFDHDAGACWVIAEPADLPAAVADLERWRHSAARVDVLLAPNPVLPTATVLARHTPHQYRALIERCREAIRAGDAYQLCLTTRFDVAASAPFDPVTTYLALRTRLPAHHGGFIRSRAFALLSASPERFLDVDGGVVRTRPIKGTRRRGGSDAEDAALAQELVDSVKERAENVMIVDLMRNDLQRVCLPGSVSAERLLEVESFSAVHQLVSTVSGRLAPRTTVGDLLDAAFPAGSMTGAPKLSAMTILHGLEAAPRGIYAGCFGWVGRDGRADLAMTIRSIVLHPGGAYVGAGGGITWLSEPDAEVAEVGIKARAPLAALGAALPPGW
ncbi:anthranilate synthase component I family protein [Microbacterium sp. VKM Ac-2870]|uniref:anthranilate synthase component I family protein n=1 Tax=Microbacterium sp. VKM Ac-2870 TaxID=2783825 RepID=UPI00188CE583|nr:anthranilate synthase component I family protein [Microbacterium sp. VKM Ac-2870]MBF4560813.1 anthranilate synthase component I family protein [Microbacterium sp. VKM Ac-2870]